MKTVNRSPERGKEAAAEEGEATRGRGGGQGKGGRRPGKGKCNKMCESH